MSRINYSDDEQYSGQFALWRSNVNRSLMGKRGQEALRKLREALLALPQKRLISGAISADGEVCAIGAALIHDEPPETREKLMRELSEIDEDEDTADWAPKYFPTLVAWAVVEENDMGLDYVTPEVRYKRMLTWVDARLAGHKLEL